jgi:8-oxo-dGTP diphosphatase
VVAIIDEIVRHHLAPAVAPFGLTRKGRAFRRTAANGDALVVGVRAAPGSQSFQARFTIELGVVVTPWLAWLRQSADISNPLVREGAVKGRLRPTWESGPSDIATCGADAAAALTAELPAYLPLLDRDELLWRLRDDGPLPGTCARVAVRAVLSAYAGDEPATRRDADAIERLDPGSGFPDWVRGSIRKRPRAVAVVVRGPQVLVIKRHFRGRDYAVLPGGGVEPGETFEQAAVRELWEETTLSARIGREVLVGEHRGRPARYFLMTSVTGEPRLSGPELLEHSPDNSFELRWASADEFDELGLAPRHLRTDLRSLLSSQPSGPPGRSSPTAPDR